MANPLLKEEVFRNQGISEGMTVSGTINKSIILWLLLGVSAVFSWTHPHITVPLIFPLIITGVILVLIMAFKKVASPFLSPFYAISEGLILGALSLYFERMYPGIVINAILLTIAVLFCMLAAYKSGVLRATPRFKKGVIMATLAIFFVYIIDLLMNTFAGTNFPYIHDSSLLGICISVFVVSIAAFNLIIDFDLIENGARVGAPKYMEWYGAFALMVTLIWLYLELLRLLAKMRN
ncbi:MAG: Bax inhibitor-1/YccA family protein [Endomicrobium sp.]|jgi:uncharacterized YccA/Bax inhibitor family protein|nr:Bax inhibitor-1/YccA family protein [Endomicrobium sp.]